MPCKTGELAASIMHLFPAFLISSPALLVQLRDRVPLDSNAMISSHSRPVLNISYRFRYFDIGTIDPSISFIPGSGGSHEGGPNMLPILILVANSLQLWLNIVWIFTLE